MPLAWNECLGVHIDLYRRSTYMGVVEHDYDLLLDRVGLGHKIKTAAGNAASLHRVKHLPGWDKGVHYIHYTQTTKHQATMPCFAKTFGTVQCVLRLSDYSLCCQMES